MAAYACDFAWVLHEVRHPRQSLILAGWLFWPWFVQVGLTWLGK